mgnify:CR=1 FL=1
MAIQGEQYLACLCPCGHHSLQLVADLPAWARAESGYFIGPASALKCSRCGRKGRPDIRLGWALDPEASRDRFRAQMEALKR